MARRGPETREVRATLGSGTPVRHALLRGPASGDDPTVKIDAGRVRAMALEEGFDLVRFGPAEVGDDGERAAAWIAARRHGEMAYLERNLPKLMDPTRVLAGARSTVSLALDYGGPPVALPGGGRIARYAAGRDYHRVFTERMRRITERLEREGLPRDRMRAGADAVPVLERALAARAGIGFLAKSSGVIHPRLGPWLLLGEVLLAADVDADGPSAGSCGTCRACLDACPTGALTAPFELDARKCLSYTTIELRGAIPVGLRAQQGDWLFGCDVCIEVCPFADQGRASLPPAAGRPRDLQNHPVVELYDLCGILELGAGEYEEHFRATAMRRARREGLRRNAAVVLGNQGDPRAVPALTRCLADPDAVLRGHAAWALGRLGARDPLLRALRSERDAGARAELRSALR
jgi:epoxyqueuosine reductase